MTSSNSQQNSFDGDYIGQIQGTATSLQLTTSGNTLTGNANAGGYIYNLSGTVQGDHCAGQLQDPQNGAAMAIEANLQGDTLLLSIAFPDLYTGGFNNVTLQFQRQTANSQNTGEMENQTPDQSELDPVLMGEWMRSQSMSGGGIAVVTQERLRISPDGTFLMYDSKAVGPMGTSQGSETLSGQWRTGQGIIHVKAAGQPGWMPYGRYVVQGASLMFTLADGSRELWQRQA
jgi:hypothetical protein